MYTSKVWGNRGLVEIRNLISGLVMGLWDIPICFNTIKM